MKRRTLTIPEPLTAPIFGFGDPLKEIDDLILDTFDRLPKVQQETEKPKLADLLKVLRDQAIFWESYSADGIDDRVRNASTNFMFDLMEALEGQDNAKLGAVVATQMLGYAERIYEQRA